MNRLLWAIITCLCSSLKNILLDNVGNRWQMSIQFLSDFLIQLTIRTSTRTYEWRFFRIFFKSSFHEMLPIVRSFSWTNSKDGFSNAFKVGIWKALQRGSIGMSRVCLDLQPRSLVVGRALTLSDICEHIFEGREERTDWLTDWGEQKGEGGDSERENKNESDVRTTRREQQSLIGKEKGNFGKREEKNARMDKI